MSDIRVTSGWGRTVDLDLSEEQQLLRSTVRKFIEAECPLTTVRSLEDDAAGFSKSYWAQGAELGWTSMLVSEAHGGCDLSGQGLCDLAIVVEEMGRLVSPGPIIPTSVVAEALGCAGSDDQCSALLPEIVIGEAIGAWAFAEAGIGWIPSRVATTAEPSAGGYRLTGVKSPVEAGAQADVLLVTAMTDVGLTTFLVPADTDGVTVTSLRGLDLVKRFAEVRLEAAEVPVSAVVGVPGGAAELTEHLLDVAAVLQCAEACGVIERVLEFTLEYLGDRYSFGRPLASYQALKHRVADMKMWLEGSHAITNAAVRAVARNDPNASELASAAKAYVGERSTSLIQECVQLHGGIGVTWEHDIHLYLRRATLGQGMYGSPADHRNRLAPMIGMGVAQG